jgi:hypothetical protein
MESRATNSPNFFESRSIVIMQHHALWGDQRDALESFTCLGRTSS